MKRDPVVVVFSQRKTAWEASERPYIRENVSYLGVCLCNGHNEEIHRGVGSDRADQRRKFDAIRFPNNDEECGHI